jgi:hypothetical protein
LVALLTSLRQ